MADPLFRKAAIDKASSPEQLDLMMRVTSPIGWLAVLTCGVILACVVAWSITGTIPDVVDGQGALFRGERLSEVKATMSGILLQMNVRAGTVLRTGDTIAIIRRAQAGVEERNADEVTIVRNEAMAQAKRGELATLRKQREVQQELVRQGLKPANALLDFDQRALGIQGEIDQLDRENRVLRARQTSTSELKVMDSGRVVEVIKTSGEQVREGDTLLRIEPEVQTSEPEFCGGDTHLILYVSSAVAGKVHAGQPARVSPLDVKKEEFGYMVGRVESVGQYAASSDDMMQKLKNDQLVKKFTEPGPVFEVRVCLVKDPANRANPYRWSSGSGPAKKIEPGLSCNASIVVEERRPYSYVVPAVKRNLGI